MDAQPPAPSSNGFRHRRMMMHMSFYWGDSAVVLFSGWPGPDDPVMYGVSLAFVFVLAMLVEWLSQCSFIKPGTNKVAAGVMRIGLYSVRYGVSYMVMLAVMSYNGGIFLAAVGGHALGYTVFGNLRKSDGSGSERRVDLPPNSC